MNNFTETPMCMNRANCYQCRNDAQFRLRFETRFGPWKCPEGLEIGTNLEDLPEKSIRAYKAKENLKQQKIRRVKNVMFALDEIEMMFPQVEKQVNTIRSFILPQIKQADNCEFGGDKLGLIDEECCGGKVKSVEGYKCIIYGTTTDRKCAMCNDFKRSVK